MNNLTRLSLCTIEYGINEISYKQLYFLKILSLMPKCLGSDTSLCAGNELKIKIFQCNGAISLFPVTSPKARNSEAHAQLKPS